MKLSFTSLAIVLTCTLIVNSTLSASNFELAQNSFVAKFVKNKRMILVKAQVDEQEGYFLIDTGADDLILNNNYFKEYASISNVGNYKDINGRKKQVEYLFIDSFRWGSLSRSKFHVQQLDFSAVERVFEEKILGLIGYEVFRNFEMMIDYDKEEITLSKLDKEGNALAPAIKAMPSYSLDFIMNEHIPILEASYGGVGIVNIGLDSGSSINIVDRKWKKDLADASHRKNKIRFLGANASRKIRQYYTVYKVDVQDQFSIRYWKAAIGKLEHFESTDIYIDGIMGINFFEIGRVAINYHQQQIHVWPNENALRWRYVNLNETENLVRKPGEEKPGASSNED